MERFVEWALSVFFEWEWLLTGFIGLVVLEGIRRYRKKTYPKSKQLPGWILVLVALVFLVVASYKTWLQKDDQLKDVRLKLQVLQEEIQKQVPNLVSGYYNAFCVDSKIVAVLMYIRNAGQVPSGAFDFAVVTNTQTLPTLKLRPERIIFHFLIGAPPQNMDMMVLTEEFIQRRVLEHPIMPGQEVRGWLLFHADILERCPMPGESAVSFSDVKGVRHEFNLGTVSVLPPIPSMNNYAGFTDITYPFVRRSNFPLIAEKIRKKYQKSE